MTTYEADVDATGATDVTAALASFLDSCSDGTAETPNVVQFATDGTYRVDGTFTIEDREHLYLDGRGCTITTVIPTDNRTRLHVDIQSSTGITLHDLHVVGPNAAAGIGDAAYVAALESQHGFNIQASSDVLLDEVSATLIYGDFVYIGAASGGLLSDGVVVRNSNFGKNGRQAFAFVGCTNVEITGCTTVECRRSLLDFEPNGLNDGIDTVSVHDNAFGKQRLSFIASKGYPEPINNISVVDNTVGSPLNSEVNPTKFGLRNNWTITGNVTSVQHGTPARATMKFSRVDGLTVTGNTQPLQINRDMHLARLADCTDYVVEGNTLTNATAQFYVANSFTGRHRHRRFRSLPSGIVGS